MSVRLSFRAALIAASIAGAGAPAFAHEIKLGSLEIIDLWTRATPPGAPTAIGFMTIENKGPDADRLVSVSSPDSAAGELHQMSTENGIMKMRPLPDGIEIPAAATVKLAPGGLHLMFVTLKSPLVEGGKLPVSLTFEKAGKINTFLHILAIGATGPDKNAMPAMNHDTIEPPK